MGKRLTWKEICEKYPDQWVGLAEVKWCDDNDATIESAVVNYVGLDRNELLRRHIAGDTYSVHTNMDGGAQIGVLEVRDIV